MLGISRKNEPLQEVAMDTNLPTVSKGKLTLV